MSDLADCPTCGENDWGGWITPSKVSCGNCGSVTPRSALVTRGSRRQLRSTKGTQAARRTRRSRKHEKESADKLGAETIAGSGNRTNPSGKSDFVVKELLRSEHKETDGAGFRIEVATLVKIEREAMKTGTLPALHIRFIRHGAPDMTYVAVREDDLAALVEEVRETKNS